MRKVVNMKAVIETLNKPSKQWLDKQKVADETTQP